MFQKLYVVDSVEADNSFSLKFQITKAGPLSIMVLGGTTTVFMTPGDKVKLSLTKENKRTRFTFTGVNAAHYSYASLVENHLRQSQAFPIFDKDKGPEIYRQEVDKWRTVKTQFLNEYIKTNTVSKLFSDFARNEIEYGYINLLYSPLSSNRLAKAGTPSSYFFVADSIIKSSNNEVKYLTGDNLRAFTYHNVMFGADDYVKNFDSIYNNILKQFKGESREAILTNFIGVYAKLQSEEYRPQLIKAMTASRGIVRDTTMLKYIVAREVEYTKLNRPFPKEIMNTTYLKKLNSSSIITLGDLLNSYNGKSVYVDFWASWCLPCREDIAQSAASKKLLNSQGIKLIYISLDTKQNESIWKKAADKDQITEDQYILTGDFKSPLISYLNAYAIPRYVLLDKDHKIKNYEAPRLNPGHFQQLKSAIMSRVISFP